MRFAIKWDSITHPILQNASKMLMEALHQTIEQGSRNPFNPFFTSNKPSWYICVRNCYQIATLLIVHYLILHG